MPATAEKPKKIGWLQTWHTRYLRAPSVIILIAANLVPLYGVLFWGWDLFTLMTAYWLETAVIGFWNIVHMAMIARWGAVFYVPFFMVHFGGFMAGHFMFLWVMFAGKTEKDIADIPQFLHTVLIDTRLWLALAALFVSHGLSFVFNVLRPWWRGERSEAKDGPSVMSGTYGRVVVMHVTILFGAMLTALFNTKTAAFVLLIVLKILVDVSAHVRKNFGPDAGSAPGMTGA